MANPLGKLELPQIWIGHQNEIGPILVENVMDEVRKGIMAIGGNTVIPNSLSILCHCRN